MERCKPTPVPLVRLRRPRATVGRLLILALWGCDTAPSTPDAASPHLEVPLRDVRVRIVPRAAGVRVRADGPVVVLGNQGNRVGTYPADHWAVLRPEPAGALTLDGQTLAADCVTLVAESGQPLRCAVREDDGWSDAASYAGRLQVCLSGEGTLEVVNHIDVEDYVGSVVANEVWPTFHAEALRAQAIAVRTFVLYQAQRRGDAPYDVIATQGSQVYRGVRTDTIGRRAVKAAQYTRGIVCTWNDGARDRLFSTYYSAACGGMTQSAAIFGPEDDIEPLAGGVDCDYCCMAPGKTYRWGPETLGADQVLARLILRSPELGSIDRLVGITAVERTAGGRLLRLRLEGSSGETADLLAERFRVAVGPEVMRSTHCDISLDEDEVVFSNGRGFGHGLGLCQWGMEGQAAAGRRAGEILRYYYPGARLTRVY